MKVRSTDPIYIQKQFIKPQPLMDAAPLFDPLKDELRKIRQSQKDDPLLKSLLNGTEKINELA
ncbi:hypothetical protein CEE37_03390 [candidate division LCP-89 bacterium B3_LCP]|uniref:Uncharacterized protein n=1 Tax=candidate division LCP-89 bacterium B3_LCP TaxID=2012998 RepID=A0A532V335_UNCL8|nr:MAG: hypothetical protein CEE37_03390 [candidate division LCP-89 bacterium B3_LCP]